jgi:hypothetical protein
MTKAKRVALAYHHDVALRAIAECRRNLELISKLSGELDPHVAGEGGGQGLVVNVVYASTKPVVDASKPVLELRS